MNATTSRRKGAGQAAKTNRKKKKRNLRRSRSSDAEAVHARLVDTVAHPRWRRLDAHRSHTSAVAETHRGLRTAESQLRRNAHAQRTSAHNETGATALNAHAQSTSAHDETRKNAHDETSATAVNEGGGPPRHRQSGEVERRVVPALVAAVQTRGVSLFFLSYYTMINYYYPDYYYHYTMIIITTLRITIHLIMTITITTS